MKERDYESLRAMRVVPTITTAEEVIRTQPKIQLPDRRAITLWNSPELSQFRGVSEGMNGEEERRHVAQAAQLDVRQAGQVGYHSQTLRSCSRLRHTPTNNRARWASTSRT